MNSVCNKYGRNENFLSENLKGRGYFEAGTDGRIILK
jgi:hypothetical protein